MNLFKLTELGEEVLATEICGVVDDVIAKSPSSVTSVTEVLQLSVATSPNSVGEVLQLSDDDVQINYRAPLGSGGFCNVYPVHLREPSGEFNTDKQPWALKKLQYLVLQNEIEAKSATADLRREAQLLSNLSHENLIQVYGVRKRDENDAQDSFAFFMVMNVLSDTLESKLETWTKNRGLFEKVVPAEAVGLRLRHVAIGIASGMEYLHSKRIIFRDLKPANIGFDSVRCVKIFDFGLALKLSKDGTCTGRDGTLRYMAPEVAASNDKAYGLSADVFSFAVLLWEIVTSRLPYKAEISAFTESTPQVDGKRPQLKYVESKDLHLLLEKSWASTPDDRPTFTEIGVELHKIALTQLPKPDSGLRKKEKQGLPQRRLLRSVFSR